MIRHVAMFRFTEDTDETAIAEIGSVLDGLPAQIPAIVHYHHGADMEVQPGNFDYVVVADFAAVADYETYRDHPKHVAVINSTIKSHIAERAAIQYSIANDAAGDS